MVIHLYLWNKKYISSKIKKYTIRLCHVKILQSLKRMRPSLGHACARLMKFVIHDRHFFFCQKKSRRIKRKKKRRKKLQVLGLQRALSIQWYYILFCQWKCLFVTLSFLMYCLFFYFNWMRSRNYIYYFCIWTPDFKYGVNVLNQCTFK